MFYIYSHNIHKSIINQPNIQLICPTYLIELVFQIYILVIHLKFLSFQSPKALKDILIGDQRRMMVWGISATNRL